MRSSAPAHPGLVFSSIALALGLAFGACKSDPLPGEATSGATYVPPDGVGDDCSNLAFEGACGACVQAKCCDAVAACYADAACAPCISSSSSSSTSASCSGPLAEAYLACASSACASACAPPEVFADCGATAPATGSCVSVSGQNACDPITNEPCDTAAGETCDATADSGFACYPSAKPLAGLCEACDIDAGEFCEAGLRCFKGQCARYCCSAADCGGGRCEFVFSSEIGLCVGAEPSTGSGGGSATSATSATGSGAGGT